MQQDGEAWVQVEWSHDQPTVDALKRHVPAADRRYDETRQRWTVRAAYGDILRRLACGFRVAEWVEGTRTTDVHTGKVREQLELF